MMLLPPERIQKILSRSGIASRREAEDLIRQQRVTVGGKTARIGDSVTAGEEEITVDGIPIESCLHLKYFALNKPAGVISTTDDPQDRPTVLDFLDEDSREKYRIYPVGRLDMDSTGLILLTNDGFLAYRLTHPKFEVPREYHVEVEPVPRPSAIASLRKGVMLEDGSSGPAKVSVIASSGGKALLGMVLHTGRKRQIRRSFDALGYRVITLNRVRFGSLGLGNLAPGSIRSMTEPEIVQLYRSTGWKWKGRDKEE